MTAPGPPPRPPAPPASDPEASAATSASRAWQGIRALVLESHDRRRAVCEALGMSFIRAKALLLLADGPATLRDLSGMLSIDAPYATRVVHDLERRGLVVRGRHPTDRRCKVVTATADGLVAAARAEQILNEPPPALRNLDAADLAALDRIVAKLLSAMRADTGRAGSAPGAG